MKATKTKKDLTPWPPTPTMIKMMGEKYGRLAILGSAGRDEFGKYYLECLCECGKVVCCILDHVRSRHTQSCGCYQSQRSSDKRTHGDTSLRGQLRKKSIVYSKWCSIKSRCFYKSTPGYVRYGGAGITMCDGYNKDYTLFKTDLGEQPSNEYSVDRIDFKGNYSCGKCIQCKSNGWPLNIRWADPETQANNKSNTVYVVVDGITMSAAQAERKRGWARGIIRSRISKGWSKEKAVNTPLGFKESANPVFQKIDELTIQYKSIREASAKTGISRERIYRLLNNVDSKWGFL